MTLRTRLSLVLGVLVLLPLLAGAILVGTVVPRTLAERSQDALRSAEAVVVTTVVDRCEAVGSAVRAVARDLAVARPAAAVQGAVDDGLAEWALVATQAGRPVAEAGPVPVDVPPLELGRCSEGEVTGPYLADSAQVDSGARRPDLVVVAGETATSGRVAAWAESVAFDGAIVARDGSQVVAATGSVTEADRYVSTTLPAPGQPFTVEVSITAPDSRLLMQTEALVVIVAVVLAVVLARWLARDLVGPVEEATEVAEQVAAGDLTRSITVVRNDEVGRLATAFNHMTEELRSYVHALESSRDAMRANLERLGEALSATHDLDTLVPVVLESALSSVGAGAGVVLLRGDEGRLAVRAEQGMADVGLPVPNDVGVGAGVLGSVAASGQSLHGVLGAGELRPVVGEPQAGQVLAVPLLRGLDVIGVIALYEPVEAEWFTDADEEALHSLAGQAAIAVENVLLHQQAQLASLTDPLTGLWNVRYLTINLGQEIERAARFQRPLSVLMLDLDHFKAVNDTYGHARGDEVLVEFAGRLRALVREVDTVARYGGEEFVVVLPETALAGACRLATRVGEAVRSVPFPGQGQPELPVTVSVGIAVFPQHGPDAGRLLGAADAALYRAKGSGRDQYAVAGAVVDEA